MRDRFESARKSLRWTAREVARRAGLKFQTQYTKVIGRRGGEIELRTAEALANAFAEGGFSLDWLLFGQGDPRAAASDQVYPAVRDDAMLRHALLQYLQGRLGERAATSAIESVMAFVETLVTAHLQASGPQRKR